MFKMTEEINKSIFWDTLAFALYRCV